MGIWDSGGNGLKIRDMTKGAPMGLILATALPLMLGNVFQQLYTLVDAGVVGRGIGLEALAALGSADNLYYLTGRRDIPQAGAVIMQYTGYSEVSPADAPTYVCVGTRDGIASWQGMQRRLERLEALDIPTEFHAYEGLPHGFGIGTDTVAEGWIDDAVAFWEARRQTAYP